jgi:cytochrome c556
MSLRILSGAAVAAILVSGLAVGASIAQANDPVAVAAARHEHFKQQGGAFKAIYDELKKPTPSIDLIKTNAATLDQLANQLPTWFPAGTGPDAAPKTKALPVVWTKPDEFKSAAARLATAANAMNAAAQSDSLDAVKAAMPALGGACKNCHDTFRAREEH